MVAEGGGVLSPAVPTCEGEPGVEAEDADVSSGGSTRQGKTRINGTPSKREPRYPGVPPDASSWRRHVESQFRNFAVERLKELARSSDPESRLAAVTARANRSANQVTLAHELLEDFQAGAYRDISWRSMALLTSAMTYLIAPQHASLQRIPLARSVDDATVMQIVVLLLRRDLRRYAQYKGYSPSEYFPA